MLRNIMQNDVGIMERIFLYYVIVCIDLSCFVTLFQQTPEKKVNDQRSRKRKADPFDGTPGEIDCSLCVVLSAPSCSRQDTAYKPPILN